MLQQAELKWNTLLAKDGLVIESNKSKVKISSVVKQNTSIFMERNLLDVLL